MTFSTSQLVLAFSWDLGGKIIKRGGTIIIGIILARLLTPEDFGLVGLATVFITITSSLSGLGLSSALIQKKEVDYLQFDSVFYLAFFTSLLLATAIFSSAPWLANFFAIPELQMVIRPLGFMVVIQGITVIQAAFLKKHLMFKEMSKAQIISSIVSGVVGIWMAFSGYGFWSLVVRGLLASIINSSMFWYLSSWKPRWRFKWDTVVELRKFSTHMFSAQILNITFEKLDSLAIAKIFSAFELGLFMRAQSLNRFIIEFASQSLSAVALPYLSSLQDDAGKLAEKTLIITKLVAFASFGLLGLLYSISYPLIFVLLGEQWLPSVEYFELLCLGGYAYPISAATLSFLTARGESRKFLQVEVVKKVMYLIAFIAGFQYGVIGFLVALAIFSLLATMLNMYVAGIGTDMTLLVQLKNIKWFAVFAFVGVLVVKLFPDLSSQLLNLFFKSTLYIVFFLLATLIGDPFPYRIILRAIRKFR